MIIGRGIISSGDFVFSLNNFLKTGGIYINNIDVRNFIQTNVTPYLGEANFLVGPTDRTNKLWDKCIQLLDEEAKNGGVLDVDTETISGVTAFNPGYIDQDLELIVGLQSDAPLKRIVNPYGGVRMAEQACAAYGYKMSEQMSEIFRKYRKTHNTAIFQIYTDEIKKARSNAIITGLPDAYGRGRVIGDYRRLALYGTDYLIDCKKEDLQSLKINPLDPLSMKLREEVSEQISALKEINKMAASYGINLDKPSQNAHEAFQAVYFGYLAAIKEQNGAAMSLGRVSTFLDIYIEQDMAKGMTEDEAQELVDQLIIKLRLARELRTPDYNELFAGDPLWVTEALGGMGSDGRPLVTKTSFRFLQTLYNLGPAPEPNLTVLWSERLPQGWKDFCAKVAIDTSSIQFENDDIMLPIYGDDYAIACCVSAMQVGQQTQFFGARANLGKALLYAINNGRDEVSGIQVGPELSELDVLTDGILDYDKVIVNYKKTLDWLAALYVSALNAIHYSHDKYAYERSQMALHDTEVERLLACGVAGLSVVADSLSAIKYGKVTPIYNENGIAVDFETEGTFPCYGNDDDRVDLIAKEIVEYFSNKLQAQPTYRNAKVTLSILTITSNVMYGKKTGSTPDGRKAKTPYAPGANPMHGRDKCGALAALHSVCKIPYDSCQDGISYTFSTIPGALGKTDKIRISNMIAILDSYVSLGGHHININVFTREILKDAMANPEKYPQLTIRVSGYAVNFIKLNKEQQLEVISRTFYETM